MSQTHDSQWSHFVAEVRRRRVVRFAVAYGAVAFVVLQIAEIVFPAFGIDEGGLRWLVIVTSLAFPPALVLAWIYDLTREGIRRTEGEPAGPFLHRLALAALLVATTAATGGLGVYLARQDLAEPITVAPGPTSTRLAEYDPDARIRSIAVLPLDDHSEDDGQAYFTASMHEELIAKLSMLDEIRVVSRTTVMRYDDTDLDMPSIGRELDVDVIIEGSVARTAERTRVTLQLIHAASDSHIETLQWDREEIDDVLAFQTEIAREVVREVAGDYDAEVITTTASNIEPEVQDAYFRGRYEYERDTPEGYRRAFDLFEEAVSEDPRLRSGPRRTRRRTLPDRDRGRRHRPGGDRAGARGGDGGDRARSRLRGGKGGSDADRAEHAPGHGTQRDDPRACDSGASGPRRGPPERRRLDRGRHGGAGIPPG